MKAEMKLQAPVPGCEEDNKCWIELNDCQMRDVISEESMLE